MPTEKFPSITNKKASSDDGANRSGKGLVARSKSARSKSRSWKQDYPADWQDKKKDLELPGISVPPPHLAIIEKGNRELERKLQELRFRPDKRLELEQRVEAYKAERKAMEDSEAYRNIIEENVRSIAHFVPTLSNQLRIERFVQLQERWVAVRENKRKNDEQFLLHKQYLVEQTMRRRQEFLQREQERAESAARRQKFTALTLAVGLSGRIQYLADRVLRERKRRSHELMLWWSVRKCQRNLRKKWAERKANDQIKAVMLIQRFVKRSVMGTAAKRRKTCANTLELFLRDNEQANKVKLSIQSFVTACKKLQSYFKKSFASLCSRRTLMEMQWERWESRMLKRMTERARRQSMHQPMAKLDSKKDARGLAKQQSFVKKGSAGVPPKGGPGPAQRRGSTLGGPSPPSAPRGSIIVTTNTGEFQTIPKYMKTLLVVLRIKKDRANYMRKYDEWKKEMNAFQDQWDKEANMRQAKALIKEKDMDEEAKKQAEREAWLAAAPNRGQQPRWSPLLSPNALAELHEWGLNQLNADQKEKEENEAAAEALFHVSSLKKT